MKNVTVLFILHSCKTLRTFYLHTNDPCINVKCNLTHTHTYKPTNRMDSEHIKQTYNIRTRWPSYNYIACSIYIYLHGRALARTCR